VCFCNYYISYFNISVDGWCKVCEYKPHDKEKHQGFKMTQISENLFIARYLANPIKDESLGEVARSSRKTRQALSAKIKRIEDRFLVLGDMLTLSGLKLSDVSDDNLELFASNCAYEGLYEKAAETIAASTAVEFYARAKAFTSTYYPDGNVRPQKEKR
tara:strand:+ start:1944 stop:2420 length:477 start_codon:yes stop_codon:yes gene_type:complete